MLIAGYFMGDIQDKPLRGEIINVHKLTGLLILCLMVLRAMWALSNPKPVLPEGTPVWQKFAERLVHVSLYLLLILMPLSGWIMSVAAGYTPHLGSMNFNLPLAKNKALSDTAFGFHSWFAIIIIALVSIHVLAALYHYLVKKDKILQRMF
jgi:cytochrome b561